MILLLDVRSRHCLSVEKYCWKNNINDHDGLIIEYIDEEASSSITTPCLIDGDTMYTEVFQICNALKDNKPINEKENQC